MAQFTEVAQRLGYPISEISRLNLDFLRKAMEYQLLKHQFLD